MDVGVISKYVFETQQGEIRDSEGNILPFIYEQGQSIAVDGVGGQPTSPTLSGSHSQPGDAALKIPRIGDPVVFKAKDHSVVAWGYLHQFVFASERRYGTEFTTVR
jgi:hypothetical protein